MLNGQLIPATSNRVLRCLALRTQTAGPTPSLSRRRRSTMATKRSTPINRELTQKGCCNQASAWSISPHTNPSRMPSAAVPRRNSRISFWAGHAPSMARRVVWHSIWGVWTPVRSPCRLRPRWRARPTRRNSSSCTGLRCCGMSLSPTIQRIQSPKRRRRN